MAQSIVKTQPHKNLYTSILVLHMIFLPPENLLSSVWGTFARLGIIDTRLHWQTELRSEAAVTCPAPRLGGLARAPCMPNAPGSAVSVRFGGGPLGPQKGEGEQRMHPPWNEIGGQGTLIP